MNSGASELTFLWKRELIRVQVLTEEVAVMHITADIKNGLVLHASSRTSEAAQRAYVSPHLARLSKYLKLLQQYTNSYYDLAERYVFIWGKRLHIEILEGFNTPGLTLRAGRIYYRATRGDETEFKAALSTFIREELARALAKELPRYEKALALRAHHFVIQDYKNKWACNYVNSGKLGFHPNLAHFPKAVLTYLIVHELAHDNFLRHDKAFWDYVKLHDPNYVTQEALLSYRKSFTTD